jgi:hypothetical protein
MGKVAFISQFKKIVNNVRQMFFNGCHFLQTTKWILYQKTSPLILILGMILILLPAPHRNQPKCLERQRKELRRDLTLWSLTTTLSVDYYLIDLLCS